MYESSEKKKLINNYLKKKSVKKKYRNIFKDLRSFKNITPVTFYITAIFVNTCSIEIIFLAKQ